MSTQKVNVLSDEIHLALQIESNSPGSAWATELRQKLQYKNAAVAEMIEKANGLLSATGKAYCSWPCSDAKRQAWDQLNKALRAAVAAEPSLGTTGDAVAAALANVGPQS